MVDCFTHINEGVKRIGDTDLNPYGKSLLKDNVLQCGTTER